MAETLFNFLHYSKGNELNLLKLKGMKYEYYENLNATNVSFFLS